LTEDSHAQRRIALNVTILPASIALVAAEEVSLSPPVFLAGDPALSRVGQVL
jgi:hypothetical protein